MNRPNLLLILTDQQRFDSLAAYGFMGGHTPHLDRLAREGAVFERCYVNSPICTPSRASLWTGQYMAGHNTTRLYDLLPNDQVLFSKRLQDLGYHTGLIGKLHVSSLHEEAERRHPNDGFSVYEWCVESSVRMDSPFNGYAQWLEQIDPAFAQRLRQEGRAVLHHPQHLHFNRWAVERSLHFLRHRPADQPFFLTVSVFDPHNPYDQYPTGFQEKLNPRQIPPPLVIPGELENRPTPLRRESQQGYLANFEDLSPQTLEEMRLGYHASLAYLDQELGTLLAELEAQGLTSSTLVVFVSDHGDMLGDHSLLVKGAFFYDPGIRVPLLMRWPGQIAAGQRIDQLVQPHDLAATFLEAAGLSPSTLQPLLPESQSLLPLARGQTPPQPYRSHAICQYRNSGISQQGYWDPPIWGTMFLQGHCKLNLYHTPGEPGLEGELYHLGHDPQELENLWDHPNHQLARRQLTEAALSWLSQSEQRWATRGGEKAPAADQKLNNGLRKQ
jgi:arylsulfatase